MVGKGGPKPDDGHAFLRGAETILFKIKHDVPWFLRTQEEKLTHKILCPQ
jgi:hypothetical protein